MGWLYQVDKYVIHVRKYCQELQRKLYALSTLTGMAILIKDTRLIAGRPQVVLDARRKKRFSHISKDYLLNVNQNQSTS
jgi:hypothetical protein